MKNAYMDVPELKLKCDTCRHKSVYSVIEPCDSCNDRYSNYEREGKREVMTDSAGEAARIAREAPIRDNVNKPSHYNQGQIEPIDVITDWQLDFCLGNTVKYISRAEHKDNYLQDLYKARYYLNREIKEWESDDGR